MKIKNKIINNVLKESAISTKYLYHFIDIKYFNKAFQKQLLKTVKPHGFLSLTESDYLPDNYGDSMIAFDKRKLLQKNRKGIEVIYDNDWFNKHPKISLYVTGYKNEKDYYEQKDYKDADEANENNDLTWEDVIEDFGEEYEFIFPGGIKFNKDDIAFIKTKNKKNVLTELKDKIK